ncbi:peptidase S8/S53 domain-containing protein [Syncephalis fuscata]|nr:peptidase S8/S53 domain-containing protein [Syncephalis fuscata]
MDHEQYRYYVLSLTDDHIDEVASLLEIDYVGPVGELASFHLFRTSLNNIDVSVHSTKPTSSLLSIMGDSTMSCSTLVKRSSLAKRDIQYLVDRDEVMQQYNSLVESTLHPNRLSRRDIQVVLSIKHISPQIPYKRHRRGVVSFKGNFDQQKKIVNALGIHDPGYRYQWHLFNRDQAKNDINITSVWQQGITGKNVVIALVDDGIDFTSEDIKENFFAKGSYDFNDHVKMPMPRLPEDVHGTRCAGEVAAVRNNVCGIGIAYEAKVAGIRILSSDITDVDEALSLNYGYQDNHIYSCSWGPPDDGQSVDGPHTVVLDAMINAIRKGRDGKGTVFVFASGNGGINDDHCNCDGYTNSIYSVTVGAIDRYNQHPYYSEACSAMMVVAYSSGSGSYIYTTNNGQNKCYGQHGGTSAAAPLVAGIYALVLSIRPDLTWRDIQHLTVNSAVTFNEEDKSWSKTATGLMHSNKYGFGKIDTFRIVELAKNHTIVNPQAFIESDMSHVNQTIHYGRDGINNSITLTQSQMTTHGFQHLEHITVTVNIEHDRRGDLEVFLISPNHVISKLSAIRKNDQSLDGFKDWTFMTVKHWDESPIGEWTLNVRANINPRLKGRLVDWRIKWWGSSVSNHSTNAPSIAPIPAPMPIATNTTSTSKIAVEPPNEQNKTMASAHNSTTDEANQANSTMSINPNNPGSSVARMHFIGYAAFGVVLALSIAGLAYWGKKRFYDRRRRGYGNDGYEFHALDLDADTDTVNGITQQTRRYVTTRELYEAFGEDDDDDDENDSNSQHEEDEEEDNEEGKQSTLPITSSIARTTLNSSITTPTRARTGELMYENELLSEDDDDPNNHPSTTH